MYIISGIKGNEFNKAILYSATFIADPKNKSESNENMNEKQIRQQEATSFIPPTLVNSQKCFNCNKFSHISSNCDNPREKGSCYGCGSMGHLIMNGPEKNQPPVRQFNSVNIITEETLITNDFLCNIFIFTDELVGNLISSINIIALGDSGSCINLIRRNILPPNIKIDEFNISRIEVIGTITCIGKVDELL